MALFSGTLNRRSLPFSPAFSVKLTNTGCFSTGKRTSSSSVRRDMVYSFSFVGWHGVSLAWFASHIYSPRRDKTFYLESPREMVRRRFALPR